jgi:hypothetical protein
MNQAIQISIGVAAPQIMTLNSFSIHTMKTSLHAQPSLFVVCHTGKWWGLGAVNDLPDTTVMFVAPISPRSCLDERHKTRVKQWVIDHDGWQIRLRY